MARAAANVDCATLSSLSPIDGRPLAEYDDHDDARVEARLARSAEAQREWAALPLTERCARLAALAALFRAERDALALLATEEMGKPIREARAEVDKCAAGLQHVAREAPGWLAPERIATEARVSLVRFEPLGVVLAIMPWNFPYWQVFRFGAGALAVGNGILLKHAPNVPRCAEQIELVAREAGLPKGLVTVVRVGVERVPALIADARVAALTFTGSVKAGRTVAGLAGAAGKKSVLELGGSDAFVVLEDADLARAADAAVGSRVQNAGQTCIAAKRWIAVDAVHDAFAGLVRERLARLRVGDPRREETEIGPLAREDIRAGLHRQVEESVRAGARLLLGGTVPAGPGWYYPPTLLADVGPGMPAFDQETFGPLAALARARDEEHALELANQSEFGLGANLWTAPERGLRLAERLEAGSVFVNDFVRSDPRLPFGGVKSSGHGRELSRHGLLEFASAKTVWVA